MLKQGIYGTLITLLCTTGLLPAYADVHNFSNASGFNNSNMQGYWSSYGSSQTTAGYNSTVLQQSQRVSQNLAAAREAYISGANQTEEGIRRFSRRPSADCNCVVPNRGEGQLNQSIQEARAFLNSIENPDAGALEITQTKLASPIW
jgi:hypothetical protein